MKTTMAESPTQILAQVFFCEFCEIFINPIHATDFSIYPENTKKLWFSDTFKGYRKITVVWNELMSWVLPFCENVKKSVTKK